MNPRIKDLWVKALQSGKYRQGQLRLIREQKTYGTEHCCLGVLCELALAEGVCKKKHTRR